MPKKGKLAPTENVFKPLPPNIFLYIQLAHIDTPLNIIDPLEIQLDQGGSLIIKCVEQYNTEGIISQDEFHLKPTYTLVLQQDNVDRINHATDNPLLIKLYMRKTEEPPIYEEEEMELEVESSQLLNMLFDKIGQDDDENEIFDYEPKVEMVLLSVGYLDIIKLFGRHRCMLREELTLYPVPECPLELRCTVRTEWHLYTLVPIAKQLTFTNMAYITFESIYNLKEEDTIDVNTLNVQLSFRSMTPLDRNEYHVIPWCSYNKFTETVIDRQDTRHVFEYFRNSVPNSACTGLKSTMEVQMHQLFAKLMRSENMDVNFDLINPREDLALVCNTFHRFLLTNTMSDILSATLAWRRYVIVVDVWNVATIEKKIGKKVIKEIGNQKVFTGVLDPAILIFPDVQSIRFAVELKYLVPKKKGRNSQISAMVHMDKPTFCIIKICLLAPLGEVYEELKAFRGTFISQNRLLFCDSLPPSVRPPSIAELQSIAYASFDAFMRDTIRYIVSRKVHGVEEKRNHFCCALQNLTNIMFKLIGCDFNLRERTTTNYDFTNLCALAYTELEERAHNLLENIEEEGLDELIVDQSLRDEQLIEYMNAIKFLNAAGDTRMANFLYEKEKLNNSSNLFTFDLIAKMERGDFAGAKQYWKTNQLDIGYEYFLGWIHIYLEYVATRDDPDPAISANSNECLLNSIRIYAQRHTRQLDGWILLYCYYKRFKYAPGYSYARWCFESKFRRCRESISKAPFSMWGIFLNVKPEFDREHANVFYDCFKMFVRLGLYEFGQVIFEDMQEECSRADRYMIGTQLKILLNQLEDDFQVTTFTFEGEDTSEMDCFNAQLNGNVEYYRGNMDAAAEYYARTLEHPITDTDTDRDQFCLSKLRLAYMSFNAGNYQQTIDALNKMNGIKLLGVVINYLMGKSYYKLDDLPKALEYFINCTTFNTHVPDIWGYLALINLQLGNNMNAILCWKYANIDPTKSITDDSIFAELDMIDIDSIDLFIDIASPPSSEDED